MFLSWGSLVGRVDNCCFLSVEKGRVRLLASCVLIIQGTNSRRRFLRTSNSSSYRGSIVSKSQASSQESSRPVRFVHRKILTKTFAEAQHVPLSSPCSPADVWVTRSVEWVPPRLCGAAWLVRVRGTVAWSGVVLLGCSLRPRRWDHRRRLLELCECLLPSVVQEKGGSSHTARWGRGWRPRGVSTRGGGSVFRRGLDLHRFWAVGALQSADGPALWTQSVDTGIGPILRECCAEDCYLGPSEIMRGRSESPA